MIAPGERVCHRHDPHVKGHVESPAGVDGFAMVLLDGETTAQPVLACDLVPIGRKEKAA